MDNIIDILKIIWPLVIIQVGMQIFSLIKLYKTGCRNLSKTLWTLIIIVFNIFGPILYLVFGVNDGANNDFN